MYNFLCDSGSGLEKSLTLAKAMQCELQGVVSRVRRLVAVFEKKDMTSSVDTLAETPTRRQGFLSRSFESWTPESKEGESSTPSQGGSTVRPHPFPRWAVGGHIPGGALFILQHNETFCTRKLVTLA